MMYMYIFICLILLVVSLKIYSVNKNIQELWFVIRHIYTELRRMEKERDENETK